MSTPSPLLQLQGVTHRYGPITALREVDLTLFEGDFCCVFGPNGAGKSTLLKIISTLMRPTLGEVRWPSRDWDRRMIGLVSHQTMLYDQLTGRENLLFYARLYGLGESVRVTEELSARMGLRSFIDLPVGACSRGMRQRLTLARALLHEPALLLLDEPFTGLDQHGSQTFARVLGEISSKQRTVLMVTHNLREGYQLASRFLILNRGRIASEQGREALAFEDLERRYFESVDGKSAEVQ